MKHASRAELDPAFTSNEEMALKKGDAVTAVVKATEVMLAKE
jgi:molybdopterin-binding protein